MDLASNGGVVWPDDNEGWCNTGSLRLDVDTSRTNVEAHRLDADSLHSHIHSFMHASVMVVSSTQIPLKPRWLRGLRIAPEDHRITIRVALHMQLCMP